MLCAIDLTELKFGSSTACLAALVAPAVGSSNAAPSSERSMAGEKTPSDAVGSPSFFSTISLSILAVATFIFSKMFSQMQAR